MVFGVSFDCGARVSGVVLEGSSQSLLEQEKGVI
jgi:hypothetical protein